MITVFTERDEFEFPEAVACAIEDNSLLLFKDPDATHVLAGFAPGTWYQFHFG